jgi:hypothetical protein
MNNIEKLDYVLRYIYDGMNKNIPNDYITKPRLEIDICPVTNIIQTELHQILAKLERDRYILRHQHNPDTSTFYEITFEGRMFKEANGYSQEAEDIKTKRFHAVLSNVLLTGGTALAGIYALGEILKWFASHLCHTH